MAAQEARKLARELRENEDKYISGELDLNKTLEKTEDLFNSIMSKNEGEHLVTASEILPDSHLIQIQSEIARKCVKSYKPDTLNFNPDEFSEKLKAYMNSSVMGDSRDKRSANNDYSTLWFKMGEKAKKFLWIVPSFDFVYGTFDAEPVQVTKKPRIVRAKEKVGDVTKPLSMSLKETLSDQDIIIEEAERVYSILLKLFRKSENNLVCYFEFVLDPTSFSRTVENMFIVTFIMKDGRIRIIEDENGLPFLAQVADAERRERNVGAVKQFAISISMEEWQALIKKFNFKKPLIPLRKRTAESQDLHV